MDVSEANYQMVAGKGLVLLDVWAPTCGPCRAVEPVVAAVAAKFAGRLRIAKLNADIEFELAKQLGVRGLPTVRLLYDGRILTKWVGGVPQAAVETAVAAALEAVA